MVILVVGMRLNEVLCLIEVLRWTCGVKTGEVFWLNMGKKQGQDCCSWEFTHFQCSLIDE